MIDDTNHTKAMRAGSGVGRRGGQAITPLIFNQNFIKIYGALMEFYTSKKGSEVVLDFR